MVNAAGLAAELATDPAELPTALHRWESAYWPVSDRTQRWALRYDAMTNRWPRPAMPLRGPTLWALNHIPSSRRGADVFTPPCAEGAQA